MSGFAIVQKLTVTSILYKKDALVPGVGNCLFLCTRRWGIDRQETKKNDKCPGVVTVGIEPYIKLPCE